MKRAIYRNIKEIKILHLFQGVVKLLFPCYINNKSALPITKSGALYVCQGYVNMTRVLNF